MARGPVEIPLAVDTGPSEKAIKNGLIDPIEDAEEALKRLGDTDAGRNLDRELNKAQRATKDLDDELDATRDSLSKLSYAAKDAGDEGRAGMGKIQNAASEVTGEVGQNLGQAVSSVRGDLSDLGQVGQDTLGGLAAVAASMGPAGLAGAFALAAGATGLGLLTAGLETAEQRRQDLQDRANDLAQAYIDAGSNVLDAMTVAARSSDIITDPEKRKEAEELVKVLGVDMSTAVRAIAGDQNALAVVNGIVNGSQNEYINLMKESTKYTTGDYSTAEKERLDQLQKQREKLGELNLVMGDANTTYQTQQQVLQDLINAQAGATKEVDEFGNTLYTLPDKTQVFVDAETGQARTDVSDFKGDLDGIPESVTVPVHLDTSGARWEFDSWMRNMSGRSVSVRGDIRLPDWQ